MELSHLALTASAGAMLLLLGLWAAVGGRRTVALTRSLGWGGALIALFVGATLEGLSAPLSESDPYTQLFLPTCILRVQALAEDPDLRTRYNVDPRLRYLPSGESVVDLEAAYATSSGLRWVKAPPVLHATPPKRSLALSPGKADQMEREVAGLYEKASSTVERFGHPVSDDPAVFARSASVGLLTLGFVGLIAGTLPLLGHGWLYGTDVAKLSRATRHPSYGSGRRQAMIGGKRGLRAWHGERARPHATLAAFGLLTILGGSVFGLMREEATRRTVYETFVQARYLRTEGIRD